VIYNNMMKTEENQSKLSKIHAWVLTIGGLSGMIAMTWQASERISMLKNPTAPLSCNLNPIIDCGSVLNNKLATLFGFPNAFIGMIVFGMLLLSGLFLLTGTKISRSYATIVLILSTILLGFSFWFFGVSLYVIEKICIFCLVGWVASIPIFVYSLQQWLSLSTKFKKLRSFVTKNHLNIIVSVYLVMAILYFLKFQEYYFG